MDIVRRKLMLATIGTYIRGLISGQTHYFSQLLWGEPPFIV